MSLKVFDKEAAKLRARISLARRYFYDYCRLKYSKHYASDRAYLREMCEKTQWFIEESPKRFLVVTVPPRHYKSFTATALAEWIFGKYRLTKKIITASYNERLSTTFARKVRNTIAERKVAGGQTVYRDIFPKTRIQYGQASASIWALEGSTQDNYLATSPDATVTGFGANIAIIDDIIKNAKEAYNDTVLQAHWDWFNNTMMQRFEGDDWKCIIIMTRWAKGDLAGRIIDAFPDQVETIAFSAVQEDGTMLCDSILSRDSYEVKTREMNPDIVEANYNQKPIDIKGRLYSEFMTYELLPEAARDLPTYNYTDTADRGNDFLCSVSYKFFDGDVYVTGVVMSDEPMEITEPLVVDMFVELNVMEATIESNNGGRGFRRNIERLLKEVRSYFKCVFIDKNQNANKEARILTSSAWVQNHVHLPHDWKQRYPKEFRDQLLNYQKKGKNAHDDAPDVFAGIYERHTEQEIEYGGVR